MSEKPRVRWDYKRQEWRHWSRPDFKTNYVFKDCRVCGKADFIGFGSYYGRCGTCSRARMAERAEFSRRAHAAVRKAIQLGNLAPLDGGVQCVDCGTPAECYDHRDYSRPLEVDPVCWSCNRIRGPATDIKLEFARR